MKGSYQAINYVNNVSNHINSQSVDTKFENESTSQQIIDVKLKECLTQNVASL